MGTISIRSSSLFSAGASSLALAVCATSSPALAQSAENSATDEDTVAADDGAAIIVTARRKALQASQEIKRNADTIVDSVTADEAGRLPDNSITEVLQRVAGVTISRFDGTNGGSSNFQIEGTGISVRGLPFTSSTLNGRQLFSANGASAISWNEVTPELMAGVDVYKASRADMIEGGTSQIDLRTHVPFDFRDTQFNVSMGGSYGDQIKKASPRISAMFSKRFDTGIGEIGVLWDLAFSRLYQQSSNMQVGALFGQYVPTSVRDDNLAFVPSSFNWGYNESKRDRYGAYQALQWEPASNLTLTNTVFYSRYSVDSLSNSGGLGQNPSESAAIQPKLGAPVEYDADGALLSGSLVLGSTGKVVPLGNTNIIPGWEWLPSQYQVDCGASYGAPSSTILWDWSFAPGSTLAKCADPGALNVNGNAGASRSKSSTLDISQSFVWEPSDRLAVRGSAQYVNSRMTGESMSIGFGRQNSGVTSFDVDLTGGLPVLSGFDIAAVLDPSTAHFGNFAYHEPNNKGTMFAGQLDLEYRLSDSGFLRKIAAGFRASQRTEDDNFAGTWWTPLGQSWLQKPAGPEWAAAGPGNIQFLNNPNVPQADWTTTTFPNFFGGKVAVPSQLLVASPELLKSYDWFYLLNTYYGLPVTVDGEQVLEPTAAQYWTDRIDKGLARTKTRIDNMAAYASLKFGHDGNGIIPAFSGNFGVRVFHDSLEGSAIIRTGATNQNFALNVEDSNAYFQANLTGGTAVPPPGGELPKIYTFVENFSPQIRKYEYTRVLPSFNIKFDVTDKFIVRGAASISAAPPNLDASRPGGDASPRSIANPTNSTALPILTGFTVNGGGANLKPTMITSQDISIEYYPSSSSFFHFDMFAKQIKDQPQFYSFIAGNLPVPAKLVTLDADGKPVLDAGGERVLTDAPLDLPWLFLQDRPSPTKATIKGFEIGGRKFFDKLPGLLGGFGIEGNLTYIDSKNPSQQANHVLSPPTENGGLNPDGTVPQTFPDLPMPGLSKWAYNVQLLYSRGKVNFRLAYNRRSKSLLSTNVNPLSFATSGGNPYWLNKSPTDFGPEQSYQVYNMVPAWVAGAGYLDMGFDYKVSEAVSLSFNAGNVLNTISRTLQEPVPGVFQPYDFNVSDRRFDVNMRVRF